MLELGNTWLAEHVQPNLKPGAAASYRGTFYKHVAPVHRGTCGWTIAVLRRSGRCWRSKRAEGMSEQGVAKIRRHIHAMFAFAQDAGLLTVNPADLAARAGRGNGQLAARGAPS